MDPKARAGGSEQFANTASDPLVEIKLSEIQRIRDALSRLRDYSPMIRVLWSQVAGLYQRKAQEAAGRRPVMANTISKE